MAENEICTCINCKVNFKSWKYTYQCQNCDDGVTDNVRDIDFNGTGYCKCSICKGTGEVETMEFMFCSEECMDELTTIE